MFLAIVAGFTCSIFSCKKSNENVQPLETIMSPNARVLESLNSIIYQNDSLTINKSDIAFSPQIGNILIGKPSTANPYGFILKVLSVENGSSKYICKTEEAGLNDAFDQLDFKSVYTDTFTTNAFFRSGTSSNIYFNGNISLANGAKLTGVIKFNTPSTTLEYLKRDKSILPEKIIILAEINSDESYIEIENPSNTPISVAEKDLIVLNNLPSIKLIIPTPIGPLPIYFKQTIKFKIFPIQLSGKFKITLHPVIKASLGAKYENNTWTNLSQIDIKAKANELIKNDFVNFSANLDATIMTPTYELAPYGSEGLKAYFAIPNIITAQVQTSHPNYSVKFSSQVKGGIKQTFWKGIKADLAVGTTLIEKTILEGDFKYNLGDTAFGGIIFYLDSTRTHGMVCALQDQRNPGQYIAWDLNPNPSNSNPPILIGGTSINFGTGKANTDRIVNRIGTGNYPAYICKTYQGGGYNDWFLPSKAELDTLYKNLRVTNKVTFGTGYWSSTEFEGYQALNAYFTSFLVPPLYANSNEPFSGKQNPTYFVRAVRSF